MSPQSGLVDIQKQPELTSSNSFRVEHDPNITDREFVKNVESYLAEFRFQVQRYDYDLSLSSQTGVWKLEDPERNEPMTTKAERSIRERRKLREPTYREEAELAGLTSLEQQLGTAQIGDSVIWFSPPGPKNQGYGEYGFGFNGKVISGFGDKKLVKMTANRFEKPTIRQFNEAFNLFVGNGFSGQTAEDFIRTPVVIKGQLSDEYVDLVFLNTFGFVFDPKERARFDHIFETRIKSHAEELHRRFKDMSPAERIRSMHALENIVAEAKKMGSSETIVFENMNFDQVNIIYGSYEPEKILGSCPVVSNNPLSGGAYGEVFGSGILFKLPPDEYGSREVLCPACGEICVRPKGKLLDACTNSKCSNPGAISCKPGGMN